MLYNYRTDKKICEINICLQIIIICEFIKPGEFSNFTESCEIIIECDNDSVSLNTTDS